MIPLKKIFPVIVILITLSLFGIIYIQVSWIRSAMLIKQDQQFQRAVNMTTDVYNEIIARTQAGVVFRLDNPVNKGLPFDINTKISPSPSDILNVNELRRYILNSMRKNRLDTSNFEFAIVRNIPDAPNLAAIRLQSAGFEKLFHINSIDSARAQEKYKVQVIPLASPSDPYNPRTESLYIIMATDDTVARQLGIMITGGVLFTMIIITAFALTIRTMLNQKKLSEIKSDFINNMTHELKTPLATISLAIDAIRNEKVMSKPEKIQYFSGIIKEENKRMNKQVESILQSALLEKDEIGLKLQATDVHQVIQNTADNLQLQLAAKNGVVDLELDAINPIIMADDVHFSNVVFNLIDNAIKYSNDNLEVRIQTYNTRKSLFIIISDNGIGMSRDTISRIFEKFYRAHTGNVHNVKGFGLGLTYVKAIVDAHKGKIKVDSTLGKGSKFTLEFPQELDKV
ncbi:HAMP domain-containing sensor histidine kinase [Chitinophaga sp. 212800010-3]|uniref:sensor histidine kinase n=1 Tax=unclassified Chitinophaga TaxID=2619133 RepID=UPI002DE20DF4|nr:Histidine kinase domain-containing protein [Chitinophaga sp. 212800010-3]